VRRGFAAAVIGGAIAACFTKPTQKTATGDGGTDALLADASPDASPDAPPVPSNYVFILATPRTLNVLSSLAAFDDYCNAAGSAHGMPGTYVAWASTSARDAIDAIGSSRGWSRPDGQPVVDTASDLLNTNFFYPPRLDETGSDYVDYPSGAHVVTATGSDGRLVAGDDCAGGSGSALTGIPDADDVRWTDNVGTIPCTGSAHVYCFGIGHVTPVQPAIDPGDRIAFVTGSAFSVSGGLSSADQLCQNEGIAAGIGSNFRALLAAGSASAASRFGSSTPWRRVDGVRITSDFTTWLAPLDLDAHGNRVRTVTFAWSGAITPTQAGSAADSCSDWTSMVPSTSRIGDPARSNLGNAFGGYNSGGCNVARRLYCFQP
jgi:hypothetical protein